MWDQPLCHGPFSNLTMVSNIELDFMFEILHPCSMTFSCDCDFFAH